jgi:microsomal dipeptidase-like Zn-dependent dipeptidase/anthranilate/para-aminobenzoate synthase component II
MNTLDHLDGLILSGGGDINPLWAGEEPLPGLHGINSERDLPELLITRLAYNRQLPILGICRGIQTLAVALGGKVCQDIDVTTVKHSQDADRSEPTHTVNVVEDSTLFNIYKDSPFGSHKSPLTLFVNSFHHQAVSEPGERFRTVATATDGIVEAIESSEMKSVLGVQWHPECMGDSGLPLFKWLVSEARAYREAHNVHNRVLTLDTHCDTPMFFPKDIHFEQRDPRILVDLHKMTEGRQDATIMVAYLPQPKIGETFSSNVAFDVQGPTEYADLIFDKIEQIVAQNQQYISIARTPADLYEDKRHGRKSIMLGIENGLALGGQLQNVKHFAQRGVVYITLCHNGDNDLCDSARGCNTHGGVSRFGEQVIREMNRLGLMVDLSHAAEKSFYDALDISATPIVCSHSSCRALCDHPRNLTDDQMRRLAAVGGVMQITLYSGFLKKQGDASILDAMAHLEHAVKIMGIDHVGIGTDFDGDGGVCGLRDSSELLQFTRQLLSRHYSERDIQKIWGGNFLRVMAQVQRDRR